ncbi:T9SS type A sorting domain-containing protein [Adhaeribacter soli]|uniref:T9SS type A sorting domain-containing protein n=1 Tax=Adhaeribacter soli TaxID=2607655 RepID=A0A5N1J1M4_9BACT|nr:T9SS type A sorting domain-containing protein [Adhaeribacter soli]KAA9339977.1 T9SS type A sorting domain-containing protein [Adhaeribacter soli]
MKKRLLLTVLLAGSISVAQAQLLFEPLQLPVQEGANRLKLAWAGGLQSPQISPIDLNNDGVQDLLVFDRTDNNILPFISNNQATDTAYTYAPEYATFFPRDLHSWVLLHDYNCDGKPDIFTAGRFDEVRVFKNTSSGNQLSFQLVKNPLQATNSIISIPSSDVPAFSDVDNDGDLDMLAFTTNSDYVTWFRNMRVENGQACSADTLNFKRETSCWGKFEEDFFTSSINLNRPCSNRYSGGKTQLHAGSTLLVLDVDNDGDKDALIGDISSEKLVFLQNGGSSTLANMTSQTNIWPPANPLNLYSFPAAYYVDVDNDQVKDLIAAPNTGGDGGAKNYEQVYFYKNTGTNSSPNFSFRKNDFLGGEMIEVGSGAAPAFVDIDSDGDLDLVIGNDYYIQGTGAAAAKLALYENTGSAAAPFYTLVTKDLAGLSPRNLMTIAPAFGDLDGDGDADLLLGESLGFIYYFRNDSQAGQPPVFTFVSNNYVGQSVGAYSTPTLADVDRDGDLDLVVGERNGNLNFFRNNGTVSAPNFSLENASFGNVSVRNPNIGAGYAAPHIADLNQNNLFDLLVGDYDGKLHYFPDIENNLAGTFTETRLWFRNQLSNSNDTLQTGRRMHPAVANLTGDNQPDLIVGLSRGGLRCFRNVGVVSGISKERAMLSNWSVFPNPVTQKATLRSMPGAKATISVTDMLGREWLQKEVAFASGETELDLTSFPAGVYLIRLSNGPETAVLGKILKINRGE